MFQLPHNIFIQLNRVVLVLILGSISLVSCVSSNPPAVVATGTHDWTGTGLLTGTDGTQRVVGLENNAVWFGPTFMSEGVLLPPIRPSYQGIAVTSTGDADTTPGITHYILAPETPVDELGIWTSPNDGIRPVRYLPAFEDTGIAHNGSTYVLRRLCQLAGIEGSEAPGQLLGSGIACRNGTSNCYSVVFGIAVGETNWSIHDSQQATLMPTTNPTLGNCPSITTSDSTDSTKRYLAVVGQNVNRVSLFKIGALQRGPVAEIAPYKPGYSTKDVVILRNSDNILHLIVLWKSEDGALIEWYTSIYNTSRGEILSSGPLRSDPVPTSTKFIEASNQADSGGLHNIYLFGGSGVQKRSYDLNDRD